MPNTYTLFTSIITSGRAPAYELAAGDSLTVHTGVMVSSDIAPGIVLDGSNHLTLRGYASGYQGVWEDLAGGSTIDITSTGAATGSYSGVELTTNSTLNNWGMVSGNVYGAIFSGSATISNAGIIQSNPGGVAALYLTGGGTRTIYNHGQIQGRIDGDAIRTLDTGNGDIDHVFNFSQLFGNVFLGGGDDIFDTTTGLATGTVDLGAGNDTARGGAQADTILGGAGNDVIRGNDGSDSLNGGDGAMDFVVFADKTASVLAQLQDGGGFSSIQVGGVGEDTIANFEGIIGGVVRDFLIGNSAPNIIDGGQGNDTLVGAAGNDTIVGGNGDDQIDGGFDFDQLTGNVGADRFRFDTALSAANIDTITDFEHGIDKIELDDAIFLALASPWSAAQFKASAAGHAATTADERILYDQSTGILWYDPDGSGAAGQQAFAKLGNGPHPAIDWTDVAIA